jgi:hypothetical protein
MKRIVRLVVAFALVTVAITCLCLFDRAVLHFLGWDTQQSDNYDAFSGSLPVMVTILGMSTIITGMWHHVNCHMDGCYRIGKHKVNGTPWCSRHQGKARPEVSVEQLLETLIERFDLLLEQREGKRGQQ